MKQTQLIKHNTEARKALIAGVNAVADSVRVTIGPKGRNALIGGLGKTTLITNDGVTIAKSITPNDPIEQLGANVLKEVAIKTNDTVGDGTTTAIVLAQAMINSGEYLISKGYDPMKLREGMILAKSDVLDSIKDIAVPVDSSDDIIRVATISSANTEDGNLIADAMEKVGNNGVVLVKSSSGVNTELEVYNGLQFDEGYVSPYLVTNQDRGTIEFDENVLVLIYDGAITSAQDILPALEISRNSSMPLLIICNSMEGEALQTVVANHLRGLIRVAVVNSPSFGTDRTNTLEDIGILTGSVVFSKDKSIDLQSISTNELGVCSSVKVTDSRTIITKTEDTKTEVESRVKDLKTLLESTESEFDKDKLKMRIARLSGGVAVIKVGGSTETEMMERKLRVEDAVNATKAATDGGIVPGGGATLDFIRRELSKSEYDSTSLSVSKDHRKLNSNPAIKAGYNIVVKSLVAPLKNILNNSGKVDSDEIIDNLNDSFLSSKTDIKVYNADTDTSEYFSDSVVADPAKVTMTAVESSVSIASTLLTTEVVIVDTVEE